MKLIIAGSRSIDEARAYKEIALLIGRDGPHPLEVSEIVSGHAPASKRLLRPGPASTYAERWSSDVVVRGVDHVGEIYARRHSIQLRLFPAEWQTLGKRAGMVRNSAMAEYADALLARWDGKSPGTRNMIETMRKLGKPTHVVIVEGK